ncbi:putative calcium-binding protein CML19 [Hibiscus syriacus]|uniref:putative calcium-binding protein CML19 n=1 Tax=Hibiscus syriacus TaxID=106335 RepID=UPI001920F624|nr:putative calcium-binding protein CML19 [Hibiscus syriacus]
MERVRRHLSDSGLCPVCNLRDEDVDHLLRDCRFARDIWNHLIKPEELRVFMGLLFRDWMWLNLYGHEGAELQWCVNTIGGELSLVEAEMVVEDLDTDGDGLLGLEGFMRLVDEVGDEDRMKDLKEAFKMYEMEAGCGFITPKSLERMLGRLSEPRSLEDCKLMISRFDLNGDGVINFDEFRLLML